MNKLLRAIKAKNLEKIRAAIESGEDVNGRDAKNRLPLSIAATSGDGPTVEELLRHGADPEGTDAEAMSPLYKCIAFGNVDGAKALIAAGANVEHSAPGVWTPLQKCAYDGFVDVLDALLEAGADPNRVVKEMSPLAMAWWGHPRDPARYERLIERLRAAGAEVDATAREWASKRAATTGGTSASAIAPSADGFTFSLFERTKAWIELFSSRRDVKRRTKLEIGEPVEPQMTHRTYPSDAQQFAAHASTFHFAYEAKAPPPPPPPAAFGPEPRFALELAKVVEGEPSFGEWTRAGDAFLFASGRFGDPCVMACDLEGNLLWKTPVAKTPRWIAATATHAVVATRDYLDESASAYEWLDLATGAHVGRTPASPPSVGAAVGDTVFAIAYRPDAPETEMVLLDGPTAPPRPLPQPAKTYPALACAGLAIVDVGSTETVRALSPDGRLVWEIPGTLHGVGDGEIFVSRGDALLIVDPESGAERWRRADVVSGDRSHYVSSAHGVVVVMTQRPAELRCYDRASGAHRWTARLAEHDPSEATSLASVSPSTPLITRDHVFATDEHYWIRAISLATGECVDWVDDRCSGEFSAVLLEDGDVVRMVVPDTGARGGLRFYRGSHTSSPPTRRSPPGPPPPPPPSGTLYLDFSGQSDEVYLELEDGTVFPAEDIIMLDTDQDGTGVGAWYLLSQDGRSEILWDVETMAHFDSLTDYLTRGAKRAFSYAPCWQEEPETNAAPVAAVSLSTSTPLPQIRKALVRRGATPEMADDLVRWLGGDAALLVPKPKSKPKRKSQRKARAR